MGSAGADAGGRWARLRPAVAGFVLAGVALAVVLDRLWSPAGAGAFSEAGLLAYFGLEARFLGRGARITMAAAAVASVAALVAPDPLSLIREALDRTAFLAGLLAGLAFLHEAARTSPLIGRAGAGLMAQPPGLRYPMVTVATHLASIVLNFGVVPLFGTAIQRGGVTGTTDSAGSALTHRRLNLALLRGFAAMTMWSPLSLSFAVTLGTVNELEWRRLVLAGLLTAAVFLAFGVLYDRMSGRNGARLRSAGRLMPEPGAHRHSLMQLFLLVAGVVALVSVLALALGHSPIIAVILAGPLIGAFWITVQDWPAGVQRAIALSLSRLWARTKLLSGYRDEIAILGGASFIGTVAAAFVPAGAIGAGLDQLALPPALLAALVGWIVITAGQIGIGPLISVTVLGSALSPPSAYGLDPLLLGVSLMGGWGLAVGSTPVAAGTLTLAKLMGIPAGVLGRQWNGAYTVCGGLVLGVWLLMLDMLIEAGLM